MRCAGSATIERMSDVPQVVAYSERPRDGMLFGDPVAVPDDSPAIDRLVAFLGRQS
jgi:hypothetical protein